jgi:threonyl-tRNA synthetase
MPGRLDATYIDESGEKKSPVMLHRAILGSLERFVGILIEEYAGSMPLWLAPIQAVIVNITDKQRQFTEEVATKLNNLGFRVESDLRNEKIGLKIREHSMQRVPYILVIGDREMEDGAVAVRARGGEDLGTVKIDQFIERLQQDLKERK